MHGDQQRLGRVPPARDADDEAPRILGQRAQPPRERRRLDEEDLVAAMVALRRIGRDEGKRIDPPAQRVPEGRGARVAHGRTRCDRPERGACCGGVLPERRLSHAVVQQRRQVDVGDRRRAREREALGLRQQLAALGDQPVAVPRQVGRRFAEARRAVQLHRQVLRRRHAHQLATVLPLADRDVRRREIREHGRAGSSPCGATCGREVGDRQDRGSPAGTPGCWPATAGRGTIITSRSWRPVSSSPAPR